MKKRSIAVEVDLSPSHSSKKIEIQGHRGARGHLPENTLHGFMLAVEQQLDGIEMDLLLTRDEDVVIHHDFFVNAQICSYADGSPVDGSYLIKDMTVAELKQLDCGRIQHPQFPRQKSIYGTKIPTLNELFDFLRSSKDPHARKIRINLEIKADSSKPEYTPSHVVIAKNIVDKVQRSTLSDQVYYSSFDFDLLAQVRLLAPEATIALLYEKPAVTKDETNPDDSWVSYLLTSADKLKASIVSPEYKLLTSEIISRFHEKGLRVLTWTVNDSDSCLKLMEMGVDGIISDYLVDMLELRANTSQPINKLKDLNPD